MSKFKIGDIVRLREGSAFFSQSKGEKGEVLGEEDSDGWVSVEWESGYENTYEVEDLYLAVEKGKMTSAKYCLSDSGGKLLGLFSSKKDLNEKIEDLLGEDIDIKDSLVVYEVSQARLVSVGWSIKY